MPRFLVEYNTLVSEKLLIRFRLIKSHIIKGLKYEFLIRDDFLLPDNLPQQLERDIDKLLNYLFRKSI